MNDFDLKKYFNKQYLTEQEDKDDNVVPEAELILPRGKEVVLQAGDFDYKRGLLVKLLDDGGYTMAYWYDKPDKPYPVEILVDGVSIKPDGKVVEMKFHPQDYYDEQDELNEVTRYSGFSRNQEDPDSEKFEPTGSVAQFREELRALFGKFKGDLRNPEFIRGVAEIMINWKSLLRSQMNEAFDELDDGYDQEMEDLIKAGPRLNKDRFEDVIYYIHNNWMAGNYGDDYAIRRISNYLNAR